jgi:hypothetical protein
MCERCLALEAAHECALARVRQAERRHGGGVPVGHPDQAFQRAAREIGEAHRASLHRHSPSATLPTCVVCDRPAIAFDGSRSAMACADHLRS